jgi:ribulose 1,5-bisphosphate synthetase/thiazole synthase
MELGSVQEPARDIPVVSEVDVAVVGAGCAGLGAALAAARNGARVALIERLGFLGGCLTATMMDTVWMFRAGDQKAVEGLAIEVLNRVKSRGGVDGVPGYRVYVDTEKFKLVADEMVLEAGIELWFHALGVAPVMANNAVSGVIIESKSGRRAIKAKVVVDASGDGDIAARAGAHFEMGRPSDGLVQPVSTSFRLSNVDFQGMRSYYSEFPDDIWFARLVKQARENGDFDVPRHSVTYHGMRPWGELTGINATRIFVKDPTDVRELTAAEVEGRRQVYAVAAMLRKYAPGFANCEVSYIATQVAARESRRVIGSYVLKGDDIVNGSTFSDAIAKAPCFVDIHDPKGIGYYAVYPKLPRSEDDPVAMSWRSGDPNSVFETNICPANMPSRQHHKEDEIRIANALTFDVPYRCLVPLRLDALLTAGRCISADHVAEGSIRYLPISFATGQAAGTAAAMAAGNGLQPRQVDVQALRRRLVEQGAYLGERG